jgi:hypothetical protein
MPIVNEVSGQVFESLQHVPQGIDRPALAAGSLLVAAACTLAMRRTYEHTEEPLAAKFPNPALAAKVLPNAKKNRQSRLAPAAAEIVGLGLIGVSIFGQPNYHTDKLDSEANTVLVDDVSLSMIKTADMGEPDTSRSAATHRGIFAADYTGKLGVVQTAGNQDVVLNLSSSWKDHTKVITRTAVNPNGGELVPAIETAASLLPANPSKPGKREGTLVINSDGTVDGSSLEMAKEAAKLKQEGIRVKVVVPGTFQGSFKLHPKSSSPSTPVPVKPELFASFGAQNVHQAKTAEQAAQVLKEEITDAGISREKRYWWTPAAIGGLLALGGFFTDKWQRAKRII